MKVQWMNEVDMMTGQECKQAGKQQWIATVSGTIGPFETQDEASEAVTRLEQSLPVELSQQRRRR